MDRETERRRLKQCDGLRDRELMTLKVRQRDTEVHYDTERDGTAVQGRKYLGCETNNVAEYWGLLLGLRHAVGLVNVCRERITVS